MGNELMPVSVELLISVYLVSASIATTIWYRNFGSKWRDKTFTKRDFCFGIIVSFCPFVNTTFAFTVSLYLFLEQIFEGEWKWFNSSFFKPKS